MKTLHKEREIQTAGQRQIIEYYGIVRGESLSEAHSGLEHQVNQRISEIEREFGRIKIVDSKISEHYNPERRGARDPETGREQWVETSTLVGLRYVATIEFDKNRNP